MSSVRVEPDLCMGSQYCLRLAPAVFTEGEDGVVALRGLPGATGPFELAGATVEAATEAARNCPAAAIQVI